MIYLLLYYKNVGLLGIKEKYKRVYNYWYSFELLSIL